MKILVVDDEKDIQLLFEQHFKDEIKSRWWEFSYVFSAEQALEVLKKDVSAKLILILSDINMPGMNGLELLKKVKEFYPEVTVFMLTAYGDAENCQQAWNLGAEEIVNKPINFLYLKNLLIDFYQRHESKGHGQ